MERKKHEFSEEDIKYIIENWGKESPHSMKNKFGCTWYAVCKVAEKHGLKIPTSNDWTEEEINTLKILANNYNISEISKIMNRTENAIYLKARRLGVVLVHNKRNWTKEEEEKLRDLWGQKSIEHISKTLKRSIFGIKVRAIRLGLGPMIENNYNVLTVSDISELLNVTRDRITGTWITLGLKLRKKNLTSKQSYYVVTIPNFIEFLKDNQNEWDSRNLELNILGLEEEWLTQKRARDIKENPLWYRKWTEEEIKMAEMLFNAQKDYAEIAVILNRSEQAVAYLLRNMGYSYRLPQFWKGEELKYLRENYKNMNYAEISAALGRTTKAVGAKAEELGFQKKLSGNREGIKHG